MAAGGKTVLVTGATGIVGRHAVRALLDKGLEVVALARDSFERVSFACQTRRVDLLDTAATLALVREIRPDALLHLAWITAHGQFWSAPQNLDWLASSINLLRAFTEAGGRRVVMAGTCAEYDLSRPLTGRLIETAGCNPATLYGVTKHALHQLIAAYANQTGLSYAWGRLFFLYGEDEPAQRLAPSITRALLNGAPAMCTSGKQVRDFLDCRDAGAAFAALLLSEVAGAVNICSGEAVSVAEFAGRIAEITGRPDLLRLGGLPDRRDEAPYLVGDPGRLLRETGFSRAFPLDAGLRDMIDGCRRKLDMRQ